MSKRCKALSRQWKSATVYLVDDNPDELCSMQHLLESSGLQAVALDSAGDFLPVYDPQKPGCLVLNLQMPDRDGLDLKQDLARRDSPPVIFLTHSADIPTCVWALKAGAFDFLVKPVDHDTFLARVREALEHDIRDRARKSRRADIQRRFDQLTPREQEVARMLYEGRSIKQIATHFGVTFQTVAKHRARVMNKMRIDGEAKLARLLFTLHRRTENQARGS